MKRGMQGLKTQRYFSSRGMFGLFFTRKNKVIIFWASLMRRKMILSSGSYLIVHRPYSLVSRVQGPGVTHNVAWCRLVIGKCCRLVFARESVERKTLKLGKLENVKPWEPSWVTRWLMDWSDSSSKRDVSRLTSLVSTLPHPVWPSLRIYYYDWPHWVFLACCCQCVSVPMHESWN